MHGGPALWDLTDRPGAPWRVQVPSDPSGAAVELTSAVLIQALGLCCGEEPGGPGEAVALARQRQPSFAPTLFSAWQAEGRHLSPALSYELDARRRRIDRFRKTADLLDAAMPGAAPLKGLEVAAHYPPGWVRYMNDLDYASPDEGELWHGVDTLVREGWQVDSGTFVMSGGRLHVLVSLRCPDEDEYALPCGVEIATFAAVGDLGGVGLLTDLPPAVAALPAVKNTVMLLHERFEQPYRARDLLDAALLLHALTGPQRDLLWSALDQLGLWPEYAELADLLGRTDLGPAPRPPRPVGPSVAATRRRRRIRQLGLLRQPVPGALRHLQRGLVRGELRGPQRWAWRTLSARVRPGWALRGGMLTFGLPVEGGRAGLAAATVGERGGAVWVDTPAGRFVLTAGDELPESVLDMLPAGDPPAGATSPDGRHAAAEPGR